MLQHDGVGINPAPLVTGDDLVAAGTGPIGLTAGEIVGAARARLNRWVAGAADT